MQKIIRSSIVLLFIFVFFVFYNSLNRETNYSTDYLVGNKLTKINLKSFNDNKIYFPFKENICESGNIYSLGITDQFFISLAQFLLIGSTQRAIAIANGKVRAV